MSLIQKFANKMGYKIIRLSDSASDMDDDEKFSHIYRKCQDYTMTSKERLYSLYNAVKYTIEHNIPGDFVECGVWKGGSSMCIALTLLEMKETKRKIYLYDTYGGMSEPTDDDYALLDKKEPAANKWKKEQKSDHNKWCYSSLDVVRVNMLSTEYPKDKIVFVKGKVEVTIPGTIPSQISLLRLDTDWYESTKHELLHLYPILSKNGVLVIDDYGHWAGAKKAVDEYFSDKQILLNRIDYTGRIGIKN